MRSCPNSRSRSSAAAGAGTALRATCRRCGPTQGAVLSGVHDPAHPQRRRHAMDALHRRATQLPEPAATLLLHEGSVFGAAARRPACLRRRRRHHAHRASVDVCCRRLKAACVDAKGALANFWSDDRPALATDGMTLQPQRWSTPGGAYRSQGVYRLASRGEARHAAPGGEYANAEFEGIEVTVDVAPGGRPEASCRPPRRSR
jgi:hypothetical protein